MVRSTSVAVLAAALFTASLVVAAVPSTIFPTQADGLRLIKTSDDDAGTWMTEEEKFEKLISQNIGFVDITDTMVLTTRDKDLHLGIEFQC
jgi:bacterial leucyl aminopeptidase